jgi:uncharacterized protein (DUF4415 family)
MSNEPPVVIDDDNPEWTDADFARAQRGGDIPAHIKAAFPKRRPGRPSGSTTSQKTQIALRVDDEVLGRFKAEGPGWQSRMNKVLRKAVGL